MFDIKNIYRISILIVQERFDLIYSSDEYKNILGFLPVISEGLSYLRKSFPDRSYTWYARALARALVGVKKGG